MSILTLISEQKILAAIKHGDFEKLSGTGKPIHWDENLLAPEDKKLAFDLLQNNGFSLPWIEKRNAIRERITAFRQSLREWRQSQPEVSQPDRLPTDLMNMLSEINQKIIDYNNSVPVENLQVSFIDATRELEVINREFPGG